MLTRRFTRVLLPLLFLIPHLPLHGGDPVTVVVEGRAVMEGITREQAKSAAIRQAYRNGIREALGVVVDAQSFVKDGLFTGEFVHAISHGHVVKETLLSQGIDTYQKTPESDPIPVYLVKMELTIVAEGGEPDPSFKVDARLNKAGFSEGEEMWVNVEATQDCWLMVLNIAANNDIAVLFPNDLQRDNFLKAGQVLQVPSERERALGIRFRVAPLPGHEKNREFIKVIATKRPIAFLEELEVRNGMTVFRNTQVALGELGQWLATVPVGERAEDLASYVVVAASQSEQ